MPLPSSSARHFNHPGMLSRFQFSSFGVCVVVYCEVVENLQCNHLGIEGEHQQLVGHRSEFLQEPVDILLVFPSVARLNCRPTESREVSHIATEDATRVGEVAEG